MKTLLICHANEKIASAALPRWLSSFSDLAGIVVIEEPPSRLKTRIKREIQRSGYLRFLDVLAFRLHYKAFRAKQDAAWEEAELLQLEERYPAIPETTRILRTSSPNAPEVEAFLKELAPDVVVAFCKTILKPKIFTLPRCGVFVMHPGVCPEYRNAHGCFWAMAENDFDRVGMTLLKIDEGVDTGPVYGYYSYAFDPLAESHIVIQRRVVTENLDALAEKLQEINAGDAPTIDTTGRSSAVWGQPWLTAYWRVKRLAKRRRAPRAVSLLYHDAVEGGRFADSGFQSADADLYKFDIEELDRHFAAAEARTDATVGNVTTWLDGAEGQGAPLFLTFDDGGTSALTLIADRLEKRGWIGHFFVTGDRIGAPGFMNEDQIRQLRDRGHVIGSHSWSHPLLMGKLSRAELDAEWRQSCARLEEILGEPIHTASVPGGFYTRAVAEAAAAAGIRALFTSEPQKKTWMVDGCHVFGRYSLVNTMGAEMSGALSTAAHSPEQRRQYMKWNAKKAAKAVAGGAYLRARAAILAKRADG